MPKLVDPAGRRARILDAAFRVVAEEGAAALSFRSVARVSGLNVGSVRNTYATARQLLADAAEEAGERMGRRLAGHDLSGRPGSHDLDSALAVLAELLPLDAARRAENTVLIEFMAAARTHEVYRATTERMSRDMRAVVAAVLTALGAEPAHAEPVTALMVGLTFEAVTGHGGLAAEEMLGLVRAAVAAGVDG